MLAAGDAYTHGSFFIARIAYIAGLSILSTIDILPGRLLYCIVCIIILSVGIWHTVIIRVALAQPPAAVAGLRVWN